VIVTTLIFAPSRIFSGDHCKTQYRGSGEKSGLRDVEEQISSGISEDPA